MKRDLKNTKTGKVHLENISILSIILCQMREFLGNVFIYDNLRKKFPCS